MAHTYQNHQFHLVWSTKNRENTINPNFKNRLYEYVGGITKQNGGVLLEMGGTLNHVHLLVGLSNLDRYSKLIQDMKGGSSLWINREHLLPTKFCWQEGYSSYSVSYAQMGAVRQYIQDQEKYHKNQTFEEEYQKFLKIHQVEYNQKFVFSNSFKNHWFHLIWSTKERANLIDKRLQNQLYVHMADIIKDCKGRILEIGGIADHVHLLVHFGSIDNYSAAIQKIKGASSLWVNEMRFFPTKFFWQEGYGSFSVSYSQVETVRQYIRNQEIHHKEQTFEQEYRDLLTAHRIPYDGFMLN
jgi:putative transposase